MFVKSKIIYVLPVGRFELSSWLKLTKLIANTKLLKIIYTGVEAIEILVFSILKYIFSNSSLDFSMLISKGVTDFIENMR